MGDWAEDESEMKALSFCLALVVVVASSENLASLTNDAAELRGRLGRLEQRLACLRQGRDDCAQVGEGVAVRKSSGTKSYPTPTELCSIPCGGVNHVKPIFRPIGLAYT